MISSTGLLNSLSNEEGDAGLSGDDGSDFDEDPVTELYAQEIEENKINENREAMLLQIKSPSYENNTLEEEFAKMKIPHHEVLSTRSFSSTGAIPKTAFSYLITNNSSNIKEEQLNSTDLQQKGISKSVNATNGSEQSTNIAWNLSPFLDAKVKSPIINQQSSILNAQVSPVKKMPGKLQPEAFAFLKTCKLNQFEADSTDNTDRYSKLEDTETPPPLPSRPPPLFKYPLGGLSTQVKASSSSAIDNSTIKEPLVAGSVIENKGENKMSQSGNICIGDENINPSNREVSVHMESQNATLKTHPIVIPESLHRNSVLLSKSLNKTQFKNIPKRTGVNLKGENICRGNIQTVPTGEKKIDEKPKLPVKPDLTHHQRLELTKISNQHKQKSELYLPRRKTELANGEKMIDTLMKKKTHSVEECHFEKLEDVRVLPKSRRSFPTDVEISTPESLSSQMINSPNKEKEYLSRNPDINVLQQAMNRPSLPQKLKSSQRSLSCNSLVQSFREFSLQLWNPPEKDKETKSSQEEVLSTEKMISSPNKEKEYLSRNPETKSSQEEVLSTEKMISSPNKEKENLSRNPDIIVLQQAINRPSLPQKLKSIQSSLSSNSLVQSFREFSLQLWNPPEKDKGSSGINPSIKALKNINTAKEEARTKNISSLPSLVKEGFWFL